MLHVIYQKTIRASEEKSRVPGTEVPLYSLIQRRAATHLQSFSEVRLTLSNRCFHNTMCSIRKNVFCGLQIPETMEQAATAMERQDLK